MTTTSLLDDEEDRPEFEPIKLHGPLTPRPLEGWTPVFRYCGPPPGEYSAALSMWVIMINEIRVENENILGRQWMVCREESGHRLLVVSPKLLNWAKEKLLEMESWLEECAYLDEEFENEATDKMIARAWRRMSPAERIAVIMENALEDEAPDITVAFDDGLFLGNSPMDDAACAIFDGLREGFNGRRSHLLHYAQ